MRQPDGVRAAPAPVNVVPEGEPNLRQVENANRRVLGVRVGEDAEKIVAEEHHRLENVVVGVVGGGPTLDFDLAVRRVPGKELQLCVCVFLCMSVCSLSIFKILNFPSIFRNSAFAG